MGKMRIKVTFNPSSCSAMYVAVFGKFCFSENFSVFLFSQEGQDRAHASGGLSLVPRSSQDLWISVSSLILFM